MSRESRKYRHIPVGPKPKIEMKAEMSAAGFPFFAEAKAALMLTDARAARRTALRC
jgi:hypothetical protein